MSTHSGSDIDVAHVQQHLVMEDMLSHEPNTVEIPVPYHLPGAAMTHDIYTHANQLVKASLPRSRSFNNFSTRDTDRPNETDATAEFSNLDKPGGMRRYHVAQQQRFAAAAAAKATNNNQEQNTPVFTPETAFEELFRPDSVCSERSRQEYTSGLYRLDTHSTTTGQPVTRHFLDYLAMTSVMNQFAGEDLSDSEGESRTDEETSLLIPKKKYTSPQKKEKANVTKTLFLLFKAFIGSGILFLPKAFLNGGLVFSILTMWVMGAISLYCFLLLLDCKKYLAGSYGDIGGVLYGPWMRNAVLFSIAISQMGFMCGGTIFIVQNVTEAIRALSHDRIHMSSGAVFIFLAIILMPLVLIRNIAKLSPTALISDVLIVAGLIVLLAYDFIEIFKDGTPTAGPNINWWFNSANYSVFIGTAVYSFEGIGLIIPIRDSMEKPEKFPAVLTFVMVLVASTLCAVGSLGYIAFGEDSKTVALLNLPEGILPNSIQMGYAIAVLLSNALTLFPTIRIIEQALFGERTGKHSLYIKWQKNNLRACIVMLGTLIAWVGANDLDKFISLIGSVCCCPLSLIFPPLFHLALEDTKGWKRAVDMFLVVFGCGVMMFTFYNTSKQWVSNA